jgi:two-component system, NtrC family, C4-dicarboxylate transport response regulator DctD
MTATANPPAILYIDDEPILCRAFQRILETAGMPVNTFGDPELAITYAQANPIAAIVCDYRMPTCNGLEVLERIERDIPFFLVSGDISIAQLVEHNPRVTQVLAKPFQPEVLLKLLRQCLPPAQQG